MDFFISPFFSFFVLLVNRKEAFSRTQKKQKRKEKKTKKPEINLKRGEEEEEKKLSLG